MDYSSSTTQQVKFSNYPKVSHYAVATLLSQSMGSFLLMTILLKLLYQRWIQSLPSHYSVMEGVVSTVAYLSPPIVEDIMQLKFWWRTKYQGLYFGITMSRALTLYMKGLRYFRDIWDPEDMTT